MGSIPTGPIFPPPTNFGILQANFGNHCEMQRASMLSLLFGFMERKSIEMLRRDTEVVASGQHILYFPIVVDAVEGDTIVDIEGNHYIDFLSSASSLNLGGLQPQIHQAVGEQMDKCTQYCTCYTLNRPMVEYAERLASVYPGGLPAKVFFTLSGSDSADIAYCLAKAYTKRDHFITFRGSFHGNTFASSNLSDMEGEELPPLSNIHRFHYFHENDPVPPDGDYLFEMNEAFKKGLSPEEIAAVFIEPIQGDGGLRPAKKEFMYQLYGFCKEHGILFICDEVQQAFFRSGSWFSIERYNLVPDGIIMGKSLGAGFPLGGFMARREIIDSLSATVCASTMAGYHIACVAGISQFDYMSQKSFRTTLDEKSCLFEKLAGNLAGKDKWKTKLILSGTGFSYGLQVFDKTTNKPDRLTAFKIVFRCYELGLLIITVAGNTIRLQPPFSISEENLKKGFELLGRAMDDIDQGYTSKDMLYFYKKRYPETDKA